MLHAMGAPMTLSLRPFICDVKRLLPQLFRWRVHRAGSGPTIRRSPLALLDKLSGMAPSAILGAVPPQLQANAVASRALAVPMLEENQGAQILANIRGVLVADAAEWAKVTDPRLAVAMQDMDAVRQAEQLGAVELREDDFGVLSVRLRPDSLDQPDHRQTTRATGRG